MKRGTAVAVNQHHDSHTIDGCPAESDAAVQRDQKRCSRLESENESQAMLGILFVLQLSWGPQKAPVAASHLAQQVQHLKQRD